jgi:fluoride exporter
LNQICILIGGGLGSLARYWVASTMLARYGSRFPYGTLMVNVTGSFAIGFLMTLFTERFAPAPWWRPLLVIGFLGGYTTFSAFEWETYSTIRNGGFWMGLINVVASVGLGYAAVWCGAHFARR